MRPKTKTKKQKDELGSEGQAQNRPTGKAGGKGTWGPLSCSEEAEAVQGSRYNLQGSKSLRETDRELQQREVASEGLVKTCPVADNSSSLLNRHVQRERWRRVKMTLKTGEVLMSFQLLRRLLWDCRS